MKTKIFTIFLATVVVVVMGLVASTLTQAEEKKKAPEITPMVLKYGSVFGPPEVSFCSHTAKLWMDMVTDRTDGAITFKTSWGSALGAPIEYIDLIRTGVLDLAWWFGDYSPRLFPIDNFTFTIPWDTPPPDISMRAKRQMREEFPEFNGDLKKNGNAILIYDTAGCPYNFQSKFKIEKLEDFRGHKCMLIGRYFGKWLKPVGLVPVVVVAHDRYTMAETGVADVDLLSDDISHSFSLNEVLPFCLTTDSTLVYNEMIMNLNTFNKLSPKAQQIFLQAGKDLEKMAVSELKRWSEMCRSAWKQEGTEFTQLPKEDWVRWIKMAPDIPAEWASDVSKLGYPGFKILHRYQEITKAMGYDWVRQWGVQ
jgi:TRAP-type C4-dicarboxylate transport system substrate-binding protein